MRRFLSAALWLSVTGTAADLLLLEHHEGLWQPIPLVLLGATLTALLWNAVASGAASRWAIGVCMALLLGAGVLGTYLHYDGNREFQLEIDATLAGWELLGESLRRGAPVLSPGSLCSIGLVGLAYLCCHPRGEP